MTPTPEQRAAIETYARGKGFRLRAVAGSGKTTTLRLLAEAEPQRRVLYAAFNRAIADEARAKFPRNTEVRTLHAMAYRHVVKGPWREKLRAGNGTIPPRAIMEATGLSPLFATAARATLERFIRSDRTRPQPGHIPAEFREARIRLIGKQAWKEEEKELLRIAREVWKRVKDPGDPFPISHDTYVRLWRDRGGRIEDFDAVFVDEAQDLDPLFAGIVERSPVQRVYVGDPHQQIYAWRGAVNAMQELSGPELPLTRSFRFGPEIADYTRKAFRLIAGRRLPLVGAPPWASMVVFDGGREAPFDHLAVLARTNVGVVEAAVDHAEDGVHIVGGVRELVWLLEDAERLRLGLRRPRPHPELSIFEDWNEVTQLAEEIGHPVARILVRLARRFDDLERLAGKIQRAHVDDERRARVTVSTVHKAKGREWDHVVLHGDFPDFAEGEADPEEPNIVYVALTRARRRLDPGPLEQTLEKLRRLHKERTA